MLGLLCLAVLSAIATNAQDTLCPYKADVALLLDASSSIGKEDYVRMKNFIKGVVSHFDIGPDSVRISAITFNNGAKVEFGLSNFTTKSQVLAAFDRFQGTDMGTLTHRALKFARQMVFTEDNGDRPDVPNIVILLTDGKSTNPAKTASEQGLLKATKARIFVIGIGWIDEDELRLIASKPLENYYYYVKDFKGLEPILAEFQHDACSEITRPSMKTPGLTTTPTTQTTRKVTQEHVTTTATSPTKGLNLVTDSCNAISDLVFAFDSSTEVSSSSFELAKNFSADLVNGLHVAANKVRVGAVKYHDDAVLEFPLNFSFEKPELIGVLHQIQKTGSGSREDKALKELSTIAFKTCLGGREYVPDVAIFLTDGKFQKPVETETLAQSAPDAGLRVFAVGIGAAVNPDGLHRLTQDRPGAGVFTASNAAELGKVRTQLLKILCNDYSPCN